MLACLKPSPYDPPPSAEFVAARRVHALEQQIAQQRQQQPQQQPQQPETPPEPEVMGLSHVNDSDLALSDVDLEEIDACFSRVRLVSMESVVGPDAEVENLLSRMRATSEAAARGLSVSNAADGEAQAPEPARRDTVEVARQLNEAFDYEEALRVLSHYVNSKNAGARAALAASCVHLAEAAMVQKDAQRAKSLAIDAVAHAVAAKEAEPSNPIGFVWFGLAISTKAKVRPPQLWEASVHQTLL